MPVPCFLLFLVSENPTQKISSKSGEIFSSVNKRSGSFRSPKTTWGGAPRGPHAMGRGLGWGRAQLGCGGPGWPPAPILRLYTPLDAKTKKTIFHEKFRRGRHRQSQIGGVLTFFPPSSSISDRGSSDVLPSTLPEGNSSPRASTASCLPPE